MYFAAAISRGVSFFVRTGFAGSGGVAFTGSGGVAFTAAGSFTAGSLVFGVTAGSSAGPALFALGAFFDLGRALITAV
jgi:hypothetical protein